jgi:hypothetical protein
MVDSPYPTLSRFLPFLALSSLACFVACASSRAHVSAPVVARAPTVRAPAPEPRTLVWTTGPGGDRQTWKVDADGAVAARYDEVRLVAAGKVWAWRAEAEEVETAPCQNDDESGAEASAAVPPPAGSGMHATIARVDATRTDVPGGSDAVEVVAVAGGDGAQELEQHVELVATVGPYLFVRESTYAYTCGAHGNVGFAFTVWDAERQTNVGVGLADGAVESEGRALASKVLAADDDVSAFAENGELEVELTEIVPTYGQEAQLSLAMQFTAPSCYACSDGAWSSYSKSTKRLAPIIPDALRAWAVAPEGVRAFARAHPELSLGGWSELPQASAAPSSQR